MGSQRVDTTEQLTFSLSFSHLVYPPCVFQSQGSLQAVSHPRPADPSVDPRLSTIFQARGVPVHAPFSGTKSRKEAGPLHFFFFFAGEAATENQQRFRVESFTRKGSGWNDSNRDTFESDQKWFGPQSFLARGVFVSVL